MPTIELTDQEAFLLKDILTNRLDTLGSLAGDERPPLLVFQKISHLRNVVNLAIYE